MKAGELILYEKRGEDEVNVTDTAMNKIKELISGIEQASQARLTSSGAVFLGRADVGKGCAMATCEAQPRPCPY